MENRNTTICVLIKVLNDEDSIIDTITSILPYATEYIICDNGSTDNTIQLCREFFTKNSVKFQIFEHQWVNLGYNYTYLYELGHKHSNAEYLWQIDPDDIIHGTLNFDDLIADTYEVRFGPSFIYYRRQIFKNTIKWKHYLVLHGYVDSDPKTRVTKEILKGDYYIQKRQLEKENNDVNKHTKYLNDAITIEEDIKNSNLDHYDLSRCYFYLGQSYTDGKNYRKGIENYKIRIKRESNFYEEIYYSMYRIGFCYRKLHNIEKAIKWYIKSWNYRPIRVEGLYHAVLLLRSEANYQDAYKYGMLGKDILVQELEDTLFVEPKLYSPSYRWDFELSISCYYVDKYGEGLDACKRLLQRTDLPDHLKHQVEHNKIFYIGG